MAGEIYPSATGREAKRAEFATPLLVYDPHYSLWKTVPDKALTIAELIGSLAVAALADYTRYL
jgi:hypothetical protein